MIKKAAFGPFFYGRMVPVTANSGSQKQSQKLIHHRGTEDTEKNIKDG